MIHGAAAPPQPPTSTRHAPGRNRTVPGRTVVTVSEQVTDGNGHSALAVELARLRAENARLLRLLKLTRQEAAPPGPAQAGLFEAPPGLVHAARRLRRRWRSSALCSLPGRTCTRSGGRTPGPGRSGWLPAVRGGWRKGVPHAERDYLPLTAEVLAAHLSGEVHIGLYPLLDGDRCWWLAADFDGPAAMLDALAYLKAARALGVPAGAGGVPVGDRRARLDVLHRPGPGGDGTPARHRAAARGDGAARADEPGQLRPAVPVPGRAARRRRRAT